MGGFSEKYKKFLSISAIVLILSSAFFPFSKAQAIVPVFDAPANVLLGTISGFTGSTAGFTGSLVAKEFGFDSIAWLVGKALLRTITTQIVNWIKTGDTRGPLFVENFLEHFSREMDNAVGLFLEQYFGRNSQLLGLLCSPFRLTLPQLLGVHRRSQDFTQQARCKLSDIVRNVENFNVNLYFNDFSHGGWDAWFAMLEPEHNMFGQYLTGVSRLERERASAFFAGQTEAQTTGGGLLSWQECETIAIPSPDGIVADERLRQNCKIMTPGKLVEDSLANAFGSGIKQLELADELNEILVAFFQLLIDQILSQGFSRTNPGTITPPPAPLFDYYLLTNGSINVTRGASGSNTITRVLISGTPAVVSVAASGLPAGTTASFTNNPCTVPCASALTISTASSTPDGSFSITVTGSPLNRTATFSLIVSP
ncbi:hypothetical protein A2757_03465 [Candidatus Giovannonibacteria bacterium RIFCSPHIGHO2_01_FULL_48_47]|nr:MAG: hypothetical protein A2757_03465 [Candidatus Giovannonibacteria bacterium RIFCSPHIGHO2_01_FULL_48_47]OGF68744.1 MAG: hypothetical protein A3D61_01480 [Candidatus Giovannonibacteria bacterium RIFCSPHIGHO2_02_FULL_48_15]OGF89892.1 MAG: hypothetical protein A3B26_00460 [Candidatus Giovannonibacteria bacterium RIFCSPLOWO2_01_FULL_48_47]OGF96323.1 MAG: hypothetical protein A2613_02060 [Candidatus Giovannonibacteria bacterium RIFOXYD1_FULL_48_21]HBT81763.1 hypothetical protein [Candidatus Gio